MTEATLQYSNTETTRRVNEKLRSELGTQICGFLSSPDVVEIMVNPDGSLWVERLGKGVERVGDMPTTHTEAVIRTVASAKKLTISDTTPIVECELPIDGSRFAGALPPATDAPMFSIRRKASQVFTFEEYIKEEILSIHDSLLLKKAIADRLNILVVGGTGSGKTTFTNAIINAIGDASPEHRLLIIEDTRELQCKARNVVRFCATAHVTYQHLLRASLRHRPDRIIIGECRGGEALDLLKAWNTGHCGGVATIHANSALSGLYRLEQMISEVSVTPMKRLIAEAINVVVFIARTPTGRKVEEVLYVSPYLDDYQNYITKRSSEL